MEYIQDSLNLAMKWKENLIRENYKVDVEGNAENDEDIQKLKDEAEFLEKRELYDNQIVVLNKLYEKLNEKLGLKFSPLNEENQKRLREYLSDEGNIRRIQESEG